MSGTQNREGLSSARLIMVPSRISPLFILWAIRGSKLVPSTYFGGACMLLVIFPNAFLFLRLWIANRHSDTRGIVIGKAEDHRDHLLAFENELQGSTEQFQRCIVCAPDARYKAHEPRLPLAFEGLSGPEDSPQPLQWPLAPGRRFKEPPPASLCAPFVVAVTEP